MHPLPDVGTCDLPHDVQILRRFPDQEGDRLPVIAEPVHRKVELVRAEDHPALALILGAQSVYRHHPGQVGEGERLDGDGDRELVQVRDVLSTDHATQRDAPHRYGLPVKAGQLGGDVGGLGPQVADGVQRWLVGEQVFIGKNGRSVLRAEALWEHPAHVGRSQTEDLK